MKAIAVIVLCSLFSPSAIGQKRNKQHLKTKILETGQFHGDEVKAKSGERWLALFPDKEGFVLLPTKLIVTRVFDPIIDDESSRRRSGKEVAVRSNREPIFLLRSSRKLRRGRVCTVFRGWKGLGNASVARFRLAGTKYELKVTSADPNPKDYLVQNTKLVLQVGKAQQTLSELEQHNDGSWSLLWAGDIDGDGWLDLYMDLSSHYNVSTKVLFLSSGARKGEFVEAVAEFTTVGC